VKEKSSEFFETVILDCYPCFDFVINYSPSHLDFSSTILSTFISSKMSSNDDDHSGHENDSAGFDDESVHYSDEEENLMEGRGQMDEPNLPGDRGPGVEDAEEDSPYGEINPDLISISTLPGWES